ncbi:MAG: zf-HC2 domain-containing protein [Saonia sp.]
MHIDEELLWSYLADEIDEANGLIIKEHLKTCNHCSKKLSVLENEEKKFQNLDYPLPSDGFNLRTSELILSKTKHTKQPWGVVFKTCLLISLLLILAISVWLVMNVNIDLPTLDNLGRIVLYVLPLAFLILVMKNFEGRMVRY